MSGSGGIARDGLRYIYRWVMLPHRVTETLLRVRSIEAALQSPPVRASEEAPAATPGEIYAGYSAADLWVFDLFAHARPDPASGFVTDFLGTRTRTSSLWTSAREMDGQVMGRPVPYDLYEAIEWIGLLKAVATARDGRFAMMELGAGFGPWLAAGAVAARLRGLDTLRLTGVEADPGRFALMRQHFVDNGLNSDEHELLPVAVGVEAGRARWPRIADPANAAGARPVRASAAGIDAADAAYMQSTLDDHIEVEILPLAGLLAHQSVWDLVHIDVQGWEAKLCAGCAGKLSERVRWMVVGTHSRAIDGQMIETMHEAGWVLENEKPTRFTYDPAKGSLELMTEVDGIQVWRNPRFA